MNNFKNEINKMTDEVLNKANEYKQQIDKLNRFVRTCRNCWHVLRLCHPKFKLKTAYGCLSDEVEVSKGLAEKILASIEDYSNELQKELDKM